MPRMAGAAGPPPAAAASMPDLLTCDVGVAIGHVLRWQHYPYSCLGLRQNASRDEIRKQYKHLALRMHPDKTEHPRAQEAFAALQAAYKRAAP